MGGSNFTACAANYALNASTNASFADTWGYQIPGYSNNTRSHVVNVPSCETLCGSGPDYYAWDHASSTITTWVFPAIGLLLQAPFESNQRRKTLLVLCRWMGSPIASLSYIFWNIKVTGKCALMSDMSVNFREPMVVKGYDDFAKMRDSLYILSVMNQYVLEPSTPGIEAGSLLRVALFSEELSLPSKALGEKRRKLALDIRKDRRRGVVAVFISMMWFLFSLIISIQQSFSAVGENETAHDLAMGFLLGWLPVLILASIVDRNPGRATEIRLKLNKFLTLVLEALEDPKKRKSLEASGEAEEGDFSWISGFQSEINYQREHSLRHDYTPFFTQFAGQGRVRWHYGVAHPILSSIETAFIARYGRGWLKARKVRHALVVGTHKDSEDEIRRFDVRESWQILSAMITVGAPITGAFIISYMTPTVGLGCRSGGYVVYFTIAMGTFVVEMLIWYLTSRMSLQARQEWRLRFNRILSFADFVNTVWLIYIVLAQTVGSYETCACQASNWAGGGYLDFDDFSYYGAHDAWVYWTVGTCIGCVAMGIGCAFIVAEWCTQSHLSTEKIEPAMRGLRRTRLFKKYTFWIREIPDHGINLFYLLRSVVFRRGRRHRRSLVWSWKSKQEAIQGQDPEGIGEGGIEMGSTKSQASHDEEALLTKRVSHTESGT
ncbi:MAG: hypothetical protein M1827_003677 [Pycnora praestabilis]|nr:MAG: hypothetical protein M1827_003677 [Pycnora praestabilis]